MGDVMKIGAAVPWPSGRHLGIQDGGHKVLMGVRLKN